MQRGRLLRNLSMVSSHDDLDDMVLARSAEESAVVAKEMFRVPTDGTYGMAVWLLRNCVASNAVPYGRLLRERMSLAHTQSEAAACCEKHFQVGKA